MKTYPALLISVIICLFWIPVLAQPLIVNRWVVAGKLSREEAFPIGNLQEYEFFKDNKYKIYEKGIVTVNGSYEIARDGKSYTLKAGRTSLSVKIVKLNMLEMHVVYDIGIALNDTMVYYMAGTPAAKIAQKKIIYADEYFKNWAVLKSLYTGRSELATGMINTVKTKITGGDSIFAAIRGYIVKADQLISGGIYVPKMQLIQYSFVQDNLSAEITKLLQIAENNSNVKSSSDFIDSKKKLLEIEKEAVKARVKFNSSFKAYYGL